MKAAAGRWKADEWNDGDSFHLVTGDEQREIVERHVLFVNVDVRCSSLCWVISAAPPKWKVPERMCEKWRPDSKTQDQLALFEADRKRLEQ